jgi:serine/alanine adding enzyme
VDPGLDGRWDEYVRSDPRARASHLGAWSRILRDAYGFRPRNLAVEDAGGTLVGVLPLLQVRGLLGSRLISLPAAWTTGPLGRTRDIERLLLSAALELVHTHRAGELRVKSFIAGLEHITPGLRCQPFRPAWAMTLPEDGDDLEDIWRSEKRLWRSVRKARNAKLTVREATSSAELRRFYTLYLVTMRKHHSFPRSLKHLELARTMLGSEIFRLFVVEHDREIVAGGIFFDFGDTLELIFNASNTRRLDLRPNHALYEHTIRWAQERRRNAFDFGGAGEGTSLGEFKRQWGAQPKPVYVYGWGKESGAEVADVGERVIGGPHVEWLWDRAPLWMTRLGGAAAWRWL